MMNMYKVKCKRDMIYWIPLTFPNNMLKTIMINLQALICLPWPQVCTSSRESFLSPLKSQLSKNPFTNWGGGRNFENLKKMNQKVAAIETRLGTKGSSFLTDKKNIACAGEMVYSIQNCPSKFLACRLCWVCWCKPGTPDPCSFLFQDSDFA